MDPLLLLLIGAGAYLYFKQQPAPPPVTPTLPIDTTSPVISAGSPNTAGPQVDIDVGTVPGDTSPNLTAPLVSEPVIIPQNIMDEMKYYGTGIDPASKLTPTGIITEWGGERYDVEGGGHIYETELEGWLEYQNVIGEEERKYAENISRILAFWNTYTPPNEFVPISQLNLGPVIDRRGHDNTLEYYLSLIPGGLEQRHYDQIAGWIQTAWGLGYTDNEIKMRIKQQAYSRAVMETVPIYGADYAKNVPEEFAYDWQSVQPIADAVLIDGTFQTFPAGSSGKVNSVSLWVGDSPPENTRAIHIASNLDFPAVLLQWDGRWAQGRSFSIGKITPDALEAMRAIGLNI